MATINFVCLACGNRFSAVALGAKSKHETACPKCKSEIVAETVPPNLSLMSEGCG